MSRAAPQLAELQALAQRLRAGGRLVTGFLRVAQTLEKAAPRLAILASDAAEPTYKQHVLDACRRRGVAVAQRLDRALLARVFRLKEREAQALLVMDWGPRWSDVDRRLFEKWFL